MKLEEIRERVFAARDVFEEPHIRASQEQLCTAALKWLKRNKQRFVRGSRDEEPWWKVEIQTDDEVILDSREFSFRSLVLYNGLSFVLSELIGSEMIIVEDNWPKFVRSDFRQMAWNYEAVARARAELPGISLTDLADRFDYENATKLRNKLMVPMAELGLWAVGEAKYKGKVGWSISVGALAKQFHEVVFIPALKAYRRGEFE